MQLFHAALDVWWVPQTQFIDSVDILVADQLWYVTGLAGGHSTDGSTDYWDCCSCVGVKLHCGVLAVGHGAGRQFWIT